MTVLMTGLLTSCRPSSAPDYLSFRNFTDGWDPLDVLVFEPVREDSVPVRGEHFDIDLVLRFSVRLPVSDFPVALTVEDAGGIVRSDTIIVPAASGRDAGVTTHFGIREVTLPLYRDMPVGEDFDLSMAPLSDRRLTRSLRSCGVVIRKTDSKPRKL